MTAFTRSKSLVIKGARENNLKNIDVEIPREQLVVITGLSGSGKSSLAFETIYAEGQRRFLDSLSAYARRRVEQVKKPDVDFVYGLSPVVSIEQKTVGRNPRSTIGTMTDIYDYMRVLFATAGAAHCPYCRREIPIRTPHQIAERLFQMRLEQFLVFKKPFPALVEIQRLEKGNGLIAKSFERRAHSAPTSSNQPSSSITSMPSALACVSFDPAPGPATTRSVFLETEPAVFAP